MSIFNKLFDKKQANNAQSPQQSEYRPYQKTEVKTFEDLLEQHAGLSYEKQWLLAEVIGEKDWTVNMDTGQISFGELSLPIQIIGSRAFHDNSWLWGWANSQSGIPEQLLRQSNQMQAFGKDRQIEQLTEPKFIVDEGFEYKVGMIACGLFNAKSYYCANYGEGTLVVLIDDERIPAIDLDRPEKVLTCFPQLISAMPLNHKTTFLNYLIDRGFSLNVSDNRIAGIHNGNTVVAAFDEVERLRSLNGTMNATP